MPSRRWRTQPRWSRLAASVVSPIAAGVLLLCRGDLGPAISLGGFLAAFLLQWVFDHTAPDVPARFPRLTTTLTAGACLSLAVALEQAMRL